ncbi:MAG TPA: RNase adapter RapZ [Actinomycetota bacterium]|nr:RNase adapter RapZ [Actinomycetota bacterium]
MASAVRPAKDPRRREEVEALDFTIITGLSGAGRSEAAKCFEDLGYFVVDNLPPALIGKMAELATASGNPARIAIVADVRGGVFFNELSRGLQDLKDLHVPYRILFLDASDDDLVKRFEATRRRHPLAPGDRIVEGIRKERLRMRSLKEDADLIIDTSGMSPHELRDRVRDIFAKSKAEEALQVSLVSFGYKHGLPRDADLVFDVRFLPNPHWVEPLRPLPGTNPKVRSYVTRQPGYEEFIRKLYELLDQVVPGYVMEGKSYLTIAVGCTGGKHRSAVVAEDLAEYFRKRGHSVAVEHRDLDRE